MKSKRGTQNFRRGWAIRLTLGFAAACCIMLYQNCGADFVPMSLDSASGKFFVCNQNDEMANFQRTVYSRVLRTLACKECHRAGGSGTGMFADANLEVAYQAFTADSSMQAKVQRYATMDHQGAGSPANKPWVDAEFEKFASCQEGVDVSYQALTARKPINATATDSIISFDLNSELLEGPNQTGARLHFNIRRTESGGNFIYHLSRPSLQTTARGVRIRSLKIRINGRLEQTITTFTRLDRRINPNTSHLTGTQLNGNLETATGLMMATSAAQNDDIQIEIGTLENF